MELQQLLSTDSLKHPCCYYLHSRLHVAFRKELSKDKEGPQGRSEKESAKIFLIKRILSTDFTLAKNRATDFMFWCVIPATLNKELYRLETVLHQ